MRTAPRICCQPTPRTVAQVALPRSTLAALQSVGLSLALWGCADLLGDVSVEATASVSEDSAVTTGVVFTRSHTG